MFIVKSIFEIPTSLPPPLGLTIGTFDGVHLGHQHLIRTLCAKVSPQGTAGVLTFTNHPSEILKKSPPPSSLCTIKEKIYLLEQLGVDLLILLPFSQEMAHLSYETFIENIRKYYPFSQLVLGKGAVFGKGGHGNEEALKKLGSQMGFETQFVEKITQGGRTVSSGLIRELLEKGDEKGAKDLLGHS